MVADFEELDARPRHSGSLLVWCGVVFGGEMGGVRGMYSSGLYHVCSSFEAGCTVTQPPVYSPPVHREDDLDRPIDNLPGAVLWNPSPNPTPNILCHRYSFVSISILHAHLPVQPRLCHRNEPSSCRMMNGGVCTRHLVDLFRSPESPRQDDRIGLEHLRVRSNHWVVR